MEIVLHSQNVQLCVQVTIAARLMKWLQSSWQSIQSHVTQLKVKTNIWSCIQM